MKPQVQIVLFSLLASFSSHSVAQSYVVVHTGPEGSESYPTFIYVLSPPERMSGSALINRKKREEIHYPLNGFLTLIEMPIGLNKLVHLDFTPTMKGDDRTSYFPQDLEIDIAENSTYYFSPLSLTGNEFDESSLLAIKELLCSHFSEEIASSTNLRFVRYGHNDTVTNLDCE